MPKNINNSNRIFLKHRRSHLYLIQNLRRANADARINPWRRVLLAHLLRGTFEEFDDAILVIQRHHTVGFVPLVQQQRGLGTTLLMKTQHGGKILIGDDVSVMDEKRWLVPKESLDILESARGAQKSGLM